MDKELSTALLRQHALSYPHRSPISGLARFLPPGQEGMKCTNTLAGALQTIPNELSIGCRLEVQ